MSKQLVADRDILVSCRLIEAFHWIRAHYPYWGRNGGRDHIVVGGQLLADCWLAGSRAVWGATLPRCASLLPATVGQAPAAVAPSPSAPRRCSCRLQPAAVHDEGSASCAAPSHHHLHWGRTELPHFSIQDCPFSNLGDIMVA